MQAHHAHFTCSAARATSALWCSHAPGIHDHTQKTPKQQQPHALAQQLVPHRCFNPGALTHQVYTTTHNHTQKCNIRTHQVYTTTHNHTQKCNIRTHQVYTTIHKNATYARTKCTQPHTKMQHTHAPSVHNHSQKCNIRTHQVYTTTHNHTQRCNIRTHLLSSSCCISASMSVPSRTTQAMPYPSKIASGASHTPGTVKEASTSAPHSSMTCTSTYASSGSIHRSSEKDGQHIW